MSVERNSVLDGLEWTGCNVGCAGSAEEHHAVVESAIIRASQDEALALFHSVPAGCSDKIVMAYAFSILHVLQSDGCVSAESCFNILCANAPGDHGKFYDAFEFLLDKFYGKDGSEMRIGKLFPAEEEGSK